ncbi:MAG TPA: hypothetical protein VFH47_04655 [Candidatus Thermoplasmatota archaeon]|nr:hypothetical protein [Candidatus Thermoplasmatota archaeon]
MWLLWRAQTLSVELLRLQLLKLSARPTQKWLYATVSFLGVAIHEASHATVLLLSGHGIRSFKVGMESGSVTPSRERRGVGLLFFLVAALAPLFLPPVLFFGLLVWLGGRGADPWPDGEAAGSMGLMPALAVLQEVLLEFPKALALRIANLDLLTWQGAVLLAVALLAMPAGRPSHVKGSRYHDRDEGDVAVVRRSIRRRPVPFILFLLLLYASYLVVAGSGSAAAARAYWHTFATLWGIALCGIVLALLGALWWTLPVLDGRIRAGFAWTPVLAFAAVQLAGRATPLPLWGINAASLAAWALAALALAAVLPRRPWARAWPGR